MSWLRYPALGLIAADEYLKTVYSGGSPTEALGNAITRGVHTSIMLPNKSGKLNVPGKPTVPDTFDRRAMSMSKL